MTLVLNDTYKLFNNIIRGKQENEDIDRKVRALNEGSKHLLQRSLELGKKPLDLLKDPIDVVTTINTNVVSLPTDFVSLEDLWIKDGSGAYKPFPNQNIVNFKELKLRKFTDFFNTDDTGEPLLAAVRGKQLYFDRHFSANGTDDIRLDYFKLPDEIIATDKLNITSVVGTFVVGETVTGGTSTATGTIQTVDPTFLEVLTSRRNGIFAAGETLTGSPSGATATQVGAMVEKPQTLEWSNDYSLLLATAASSLYFYIIGSSEAQEKSQILDALINEKSSITPSGHFRFRINR